MLPHIRDEVTTAVQVHSPSRRKKSIRASSNAHGSSIEQACPGPEMTTCRAPKIPAAVTRPASSDASCAPLMTSVGAPMVARRGACCTPPAPERFARCFRPIACASSRRTGSSPSAPAAFLENPARRVRACACADSPEDRATYTHQCGSGCYRRPGCCRQ